jgi:3-hydroxybutyryl-CoA dehydrogenase
MGCYNSLVAAISGYRTVLYDADESVLARVPERHRELAALFVGAGFCSEADLPQALARVSVSGDLATAVADADLVSESVFERIDVKRDVHRLLDAHCPPRTILTTNTSALRVSDIEDVVARGDRFAALHSHFGSPLVDIVPGPRTDPAVIDTLKRFVESVSGVPLVLRKEHPGYLLNAMLGPVLRAGLALHVTSGVPLETVDRAWMKERRAPMGPFGLMDLFGLDLILDTWQQGTDDGTRGVHRPSVLALLQPMIERGDLGVKSGRGFYRYPEPAYQQPGFLDYDEDLWPVYRAMAVALVGSAVHLALEDIADPADIDRAWTVGMTLPSGPFALLSDWGQSAFRSALAEEVDTRRFAAEKAAAIEAWLDRSCTGLLPVEG